MSYCVCVAFRVHEGDVDAFLARVARQATNSLTEPGCRTFDAWADAARPGEVFLYEIYDDRAAFDTHLASPHFLAFDAEVAGMVEEKTVATYDREVSRG